MEVKITSLHPLPHWDGSENTFIAPSTTLDGLLQGLFNHPLLSASSGWGYCSTSRGDETDQYAHLDPSHSFFGDSREVRAETKRRVIRGVHSPSCAQHWSHIPSLHSDCRILFEVCEGLLHCHLPDVMTKFLQESKLPRKWPYLPQLSKRTHHARAQVYFPHPSLLIAIKISRAPSFFEWWSLCIEMSGLPILILLIAFY